MGLDSGQLTSWGGDGIHFTINEDFAGQVGVHRQIRKDVTDKFILKVKFLNLEGDGLLAHDPHAISLDVEVPLRSGDKEAIPLADNQAIGT